jgi:hypothetical protein
MKDIHTAEEFKTLLNTICNDLGRVFDKWTLFNNLMEAQQGPFTKALSQSQSFWSIVYGALQDAVLFGLCRAYDDNPEALTLRTVIETLKAKATFLSGLPTISDERLDADLNSVNRRTSQTVKHLLIWRDNFYAHRSAQKVIDRSTLGEKCPITYGDVNALLDNAFRIVNGYSADIFRVSNLRKMSGADDYVKVLRTLQQDAEATKRSGETSCRRAEESSRSG